MEKQVKTPVKHEVGDTLWMVPYQRSYLKQDYSDPVKVTVSKVGRKFFEVSDEYRVIGKFHLDSMIQEIDSSYKKQLYLTLEEILEKREFEQLQGKLKNFFSYHSDLKLSLEKLRKISEIVFSED